ncbi:testis-expressed protein 2 isoform X2 [Narcine bancroftii]|uniref:testis-expressed protein 2 isoform X2 n=1 Tax=Narcine bancroftii TaxID=1343680 RepID=UPI00383135AD
MMADPREEEEGQEMLSNTSNSLAVSNIEEKLHTTSFVAQGENIIIRLTSPTHTEDWENFGENEPHSSNARECAGVTPETISELNVPFSEVCLDLPLPVSSLPSSPSLSGILGELFFPSVPSSSVNSCSSSESTPFVSLVKSLSTEIESKDTSSLKPKPLSNLVKSLSAEISHHEPEVTQSKSDSKLNLHLWRQFTQPKGRTSEPKTAPPSPLLSPMECKVSFFKVPEVEAKLEDTKRKLSETIQERMNMLSKMIGDGSGGSPKFRPSLSNLCSTESLCVAGPEHRGNDTGGKNARSGLEKFRTEILKTERKESERRSNSQSSPGKCEKGKQKKRLSFTQSHGINNGTRYEICSYGDMLQIVETKPSEESTLCSHEPMFYSSQTMMPQPAPKVPRKTLICFATLAYSYFVLPLPSFFSGLYLGLACGFMIGLLIVSMHTPRHSQPTCETLQNYENLQSYNIIRESKEPEVVKGWMNEVYNYNPETNHPALTFSVFVTLEGTALKLSYPRSNIPRRATFGEGTHDVIFISHRSCDLADSKIFLVPPGLAKKRMWNKKYPICIFLSESEIYKPKCPGDRKMKTDIDVEDPEIARPSLTTEFQMRALREGRENTLFLFGRTGREKEEWFRYFLLASRVQSKDGQNHIRGLTSNFGSSPSGRLIYSDCSRRDSTEDLPYFLKTEDLAGNIRQKVLQDYNTYMSNLIVSDSHSPSWSPNHSTNSSPTKTQMPIGGEPQVSWINALIGRIFWDFLREQYWTDRVAFKIQKKLSKIRLPYFMNELALTELDLGSLLPVILHTSNPSVNQRGLWVDLEIVYNGALQMTLETKMNLCKLGKESVPEGVSLADIETERGENGM